MDSSTGGELKIIYPKGQIASPPVEVVVSASARALICHKIVFALTKPDNLVLILFVWLCV